MSLEDNTIDGTSTIFELQVVKFELNALFTFSEYSLIICKLQVPLPQ